MYFENNISNPQTLHECEESALKHHHLSLIFTIQGKILFYLNFKGLSKFSKHGKISIIISPPSQTYVGLFIDSCIQELFNIQFIVAILAPTKT